MPAKKTDPLDGYDVVDVAELDYETGQKNEAHEKKWAFKIGARVYRFKPMREWSFRTEDAFTRGDFKTWARGALVDTGKFEDLLDEGSDEWVRIVQHLVKESRTSLGEGDSSATS